MRFSSVHRETINGKSVPEAGVLIGKSGSVTSADAKYSSIHVNMENGKAHSITLCNYEFMEGCMTVDKTSCKDLLHVTQSTSGNELDSKLWSCNLAEKVVANMIEEKPESSVQNVNAINELRTSLGYVKVSATSDTPSKKDRPFPTLVAAARMCAVFDSPAKASGTPNLGHRNRSQKTHDLREIESIPKRN